VSSSRDAELATTTELPSWLRAYEQAQAIIARAARALTEVAEPPVDLRPAADHLSKVLGSIYGAIDNRTDRLSDTRGAMAGIDEANSALELGAQHDEALADIQPLLGQAREQLTHCEQHFSRLPGEMPPSGRPLRASTAAPSLHWVERKPLTPRIRVPDPPPEPVPELPPLEPPKNVTELQKTMDLVRERAEKRSKEREQRMVERDAAREARLAKTEIDPPEGFASPIDPAITEEGFAHRRARDFFEEVAMLGSQRTPQLGDAWRSIEFLERRMLTAVDAIATLGEPALRQVEELVVDSPAKDPARAFAATMILGCIEGRDALAAAERVIYHLSAADPEVARYSAEALKIVPHPHVGLTMRTMLAESDEAYRTLAIDVLAARGEASLEELLRSASDPSPSVAAIALPALALAAPSEPQLSPLLLHAAANEELAPAAWLAMALCGHPHSTHAPRAALGGPDEAQAALALALVCDHDIAQLLLERLVAAPTPGLATAVGWAGSPAAVEPLIALLTHDDEDVSTAAAYALDRITGAQLYEEAEIEPEEVIIPDAPEPDVGDHPPPPPKPLTAEVSDPRDEPAAGSPDTIVRPTTDPARWQAFWVARQEDYKPEARYRRGHGYTPVVSLWELDGWILSAPERLFLQHELVVRTGRHVRFDPRDLIAVQHAALKEWEPIVQSAASSPGSWSRPGRRS